MGSFYIQVPSGQWIATHHIVSLAIEGSGIDDQERHAVHAKMITGERQVLNSVQGAESSQQAQGYVDTFIRSLGAKQVDARG